MKNTNGMNINMFYITKQFTYVTSNLKIKERFDIYKIFLLIVCAILILFFFRWKNG